MVLRPPASPRLTDVDALELRGVVKRLPGPPDPVLDGVDLRVEQGRTFGVVGRAVVHDHELVVALEVGGRDRAEGATDRRGGIARRDDHRYGWSGHGRERIRPAPS